VITCSEKVICVFRGELYNSFLDTYILTHLFILNCHIHKQEYVRHNFSKMRLIKFDTIEVRLYEIKLNKNYYL